MTNSQPVDYEVCLEGKSEAEQKDILAELPTLPGFFDVAVHHDYGHAHATFRRVTDRQSSATFDRLAATFHNLPANFRGAWGRDHKVT